jgi:alkaline phosphatase D
MFWILLVAACAPDADKPGTDTPDTDTACTAVGYTDADGDGWGAGAARPDCTPGAGLAPRSGDCDDTRRDVGPDVPERCDGIDQDCDGDIDDGVPTDGVGCADTPAPDAPARPGTISVTVRTDDGFFDGTLNAAELCVGTQCRRMDIPDWLDRLPGATETYHLDGWNLDAVESFTLRTGSGRDGWQLACAQVSVDGRPIYCGDSLAVSIGSGGGEIASWSPALALECQGCGPSPLTHGPLLGAVTPREARIRIRTDAMRRVRLRVDGAHVATAWPIPADDFAHVFVVRGLSPATRYTYELEVDDVIEGPFQFTTPSEEPAPLRLAFGSCTLFDDEEAFTDLRAWAPEVFVFAGDSHYGETDSREAHRAHYRAAQARPARAALFREAVTLATWDDHDFTGNNDAGDEAAKAEILAAFQEAWANGGYGLPGVPGVFGAWEGNGVQVVLLDDRYWRDVEGSILGTAQEDWLLATVAASPAVFHLVVSGSQWTREGAEDSWADWPVAQDRVLDALSGIPGVVLLDGDVHRAEFRAVPAAGYTLPALTSSPLSNIGGACPERDPDLLACYTGSNYFMGLEIDPTAADPVLVAQIMEVGGGLVDTWEIRASTLR